jgi:predicted small lipoprotein YifL
VGEAGPVTVEALPPSKVNATPDATTAQATDDAAMLADRDYPLVADADLYAWTAAGGPLPVDESQSRPSRPEPASATLETAAADE